MEIKRILNETVQTLRGPSQREIDASLRSATVKELGVMIIEDADLGATEELIRRAREKRSQRSVQEPSEQI